MRRDLAAITRRVEKMRQRARLLTLPPLVITYTGDWDEADRLAYATATDAEKSAIEDRYFGSLPDHPDPLGIRGIVVVRAERPPDDDDEDNLPAGMTAEQVAEAIRQRDRVSAEMALEAALEAEREPVADGDPLDPTPWADPQDILYEHPQFGSVTRAEHQARRRLAREHADRIAEQRARAVSSYTSYNRLGVER